MSIQYNKLPNEIFFDYAQRLLQNRQEYDLDRSEIYELLYDKRVSSDHARKALTVLQMTIDECNKDVNGGVNTEKYKETIQINKDSAHSNKLIAMSQEEAKNPSFLLKAHGFSDNIWELTSAKNSIWNMSSKNNTTKTLYSSKISVKPLETYNIWNETDIRELFKQLELSNKNVCINTGKQQQYNNSDDILIIPIADLHYGLVCDPYITGNAYDLDIAESLYYYTLNDIIKRTKEKKFKKILFVLGNDAINFDNIHGTTTAGTPQDMASDWFNIVKKSTQLFINGINMLKNIAPVDVHYVVSNHDLHSMFGIMQVIKTWFKDSTNVKIIDDSPMPRKYYKIGKTLLCLSHDIRVKDALKLVTTEAKDFWSNSEHMICLLAHKHQAMQYEKHGYLEIYRLPTISGMSRWSINQGYIQTEYKNQSFIINDELGITDIINTVSQLPTT